jgi:hypothetical protein
MESRDPRRQRVDRKLGRLVSRFWAVVAFVAALAAGSFGLVLLLDGQVPAVVVLALGGVFAWLGIRAWRDPAGLGELLNRDFQKPSDDNPD